MAIRSSKCSIKPFATTYITVPPSRRYLSAQALDSKRVVKMVLETAQLLSTAIFINSAVTYDNLYKPTHIKHPCTIWAAANIENWDWLFRHFIALCEEYSLRYKATCF